MVVHCNLLMLQGSDASVQAIMLSATPAQLETCQHDWPSCDQIYMGCWAADIMALGKLTANLQMFA